MKVEHPKKYDGKLTAAMRAAILAGAVAVTGGCSVDKNPVMGDVPAPEPISTNDSPEEIITLGKIPSVIRGELPIESVEEETLPQDVDFSEEMLTPRMVAIPAYLPAHLEKVANEAVVEQPKGEDEKEIIIERILGKPAPATMDLPPEPPETILMGAIVPTIPPSPVPPTTKEDSAAEEDAKAREELAGLVQTLAKEKAESEEAEPKD
ncbi:MAG: hypothetical protein J6V41_04340 [Kiritimatiellae bacterium]|nr:hypothetical protein [Kiritimatiellia bacterium]